MSDTIHTHEITDTRWFFAPKPGKKAKFTIASDRNHFSYEIKAISTNENGGKLLFLSVLTGPNNESDYSFVGTLMRHNDGQVRIKPSRKSKVRLDALSVRAFMWTFDRMQRGDDLKGVRVMHAGRCCVCGTLLTTPESIEMGIGPVCRINQGW